MRNMFGVKCRSAGYHGDLYAVFMTYVALLLYLTRTNYGVKISSITVPRSIDNTTAEPVKLNCIFEYNQTSEANLKDRELIIKWKWNNSTVIYQWVYKGTPSVNKNFKDYIDTRYEVSPNTRPTSLPLTFHRKSVDLTGKYTCLITTFTDEDSADAELQVYVPINEIELNVTYDNETNDLNITCEAAGVYPQPKLELTADKNISLELIESSTVQEDYLYDVTATYRISLDDLGAFTTFNCTVSLPAANISQSTTYQYKKSGSEISDNSITSKYTDNSTSQEGDNAAGSLHRCNCNLLLLVYSLLVISILRK